MTRIGLLSDTHGHWDDRYLEYFKDCDEVWHAGDIISEEIADRIQAVKPIRFVYGNADGYNMRLRFPKDWKFTLEGVTVWLTHIGGYPGHYSRDVYPFLRINPPRLFVCGHSHILKVMYDPNLKMLVLNPGAAGRYGQQTVSTLMRFTLDAGEIKDLQVIELR